jgi:glutamate/tyrosine decarboxylase-like PLP-dependent enzyme
MTGINARAATAADSGAIAGPTAMTDSFLHPCFLGPYAENDTLLEKLVLEFLRDHVYWRRNFHPEDPPTIPTTATQQPDYQAFEARLRRELHSLSAALKRSVPFHSPRYMGHMVSDLLLPGLAAQFLALPYNPNNVSAEAAPVTVDMEVKVGLQLARMLGFPDDPSKPDCAFGHLTSGGTVANYQALRLALALKAFPVALRTAAPPGLDLPVDDWQAFNLGPAAGIELYMAWQAWLAAQPPRDRARWRARVEAARIEQVGLPRFFAEHPQIEPPVVLVPASAHYSWSKGMKLLGLGRGQLWTVGESGMRLCPDRLAATLERARTTRKPVLMAVAVLGTTEYGTIDPVDAVVAERDRRLGEAFGFSVHVDAAWGGYLATLFRNPDGSLRSRDEVAGEFRRFPSPQVHAAVAALARADSVTVDPHKLGYLPYGAGAFICRDHRPIELLAEEADYVFTPEATPDYMQRYRQLGRYIIEGSKSGAAAAAVYVTHRVLPLDHAHFGRLSVPSILAAEAFHDRLPGWAAQVADVVHLCTPVMPDSNLVCIALNPVGNRSVAQANVFARRLYAHLQCDPSQPLQTRDFFGSMTTLRPAALGEAALNALLGQLDIDPASFDQGQEGDDRLVVLRHTLMNPFLLDEANGADYIDQYFAYLTRLLRALARAETHPAAA